MASMSETDQDVRALQIIGTALIAGPAIFLAIVIFLRRDPEFLKERPPGDVITWASLAVGIAVIATSMLLPQPRGGDIGRIRGHFIVRLAIVESGALFGAVAYMLEGEPFSIGIAALCLAVMATLHFPTRDRVDRLLADRA
jgi:hypothetical protein